MTHQHEASWPILAGGKRVGTLAWRQEPLPWKWKIVGSSPQSGSAAFKADALAAIKAAHRRTARMEARHG